MSTELITEEDKTGFYLTRFYGGEEKGICYQITTEDGKYIQLTKFQMKKLLLYFEEPV